MRWILVLVSLLAVPLSWSDFIPSVRVDHENRASHGCFHAAITMGRAGPEPQPVYVAFQNDSFVGIVSVRQDVYFQKSTDGGLTWLAEDKLVRRGAALACYPDITTDREGRIYICYAERLSGGSNGHAWCVSSTDGGATWTSPKQIDDNSSAVSLGWARIAADTAGNLFAAWNDKRTGYMHIWSSVSTDRGASWRANVRVDDDTVPSDCFHADVAVQPGTNAYLAVSSYPYWVRPGYISSHAMFTRSTDQGQTFAPCTVLDTFGGYCGQPHVVADAGRIICDYTGNSGGNQQHSQSRTSTDAGSSWLPQQEITRLDTSYSSYLNGAKLALDASGRVHTALMVCDLKYWEYEVYYAFSTDHGTTWSEREQVNDVTTEIQGDPDIAADSSGYAYVVWQDGRNRRNEIWFSTNSQTGISEGPRAGPRVRLTCYPTLFRNQTRLMLSGPVGPGQSFQVHDASGREVRELSRPRSTGAGAVSIVWDGTDQTGRHCPPGVYLITTRALSGSAARFKVVRLP